MPSTNPPAQWVIDDRLVLGQGDTKKVYKNSLERIFRLTGIKMTDRANPANLFRDSRELVEIQVIEKLANLLSSVEVGLRVAELEHAQDFAALCFDEMMKQARERMRRHAQTHAQVTGNWIQYCDVDAANQQLNDLIRHRDDYEPTGSTSDLPRTRSRGSMGPRRVEALQRQLSVALAPNMYRRQQLTDAWNDARTQVSTIPQAPVASTGFSKSGRPLGRPKQAVPTLNLQTQLQRLQQQLETNRGLREQLSDQLKRNNAELEKKEGELKKKEGELEKKEGELEKQKKELQKQKEELQKRDQQLHQQNKLVVNQEEELGKHRLASNFLFEKFQDFEKRIEALVAENQRLKEGKQASIQKPDEVPEKEAGPSKDVGDGTPVAPVDDDVTMPDVVDSGSSLPAQGISEQGQAPEAPKTQGVSSPRESSSKARDVDTPMSGMGSRESSPEEGQVLEADVVPGIAVQACGHSSSGNLGASVPIPEEYLAGMADLEDDSGPEGVGPGEPDPEERPKGPRAWRQKGYTLSIVNELTAPTGKGENVVRVDAAPSSRPGPAGAGKRGASAAQSPAPEWPGRGTVTPQPVPQARLAMSGFLTMLGSVDRHLPGPQKVVQPAGAKRKAEAILVLEAKRRDVRGPGDSRGLVGSSADSSASTKEHATHSSMTSFPHAANSSMTLSLAGVVGSDPASPQSAKPADGRTGPLETTDSKGQSSRTAPPASGHVRLCPQIRGLRERGMGGTATQLPTQPRSIQLSVQGMQRTLNYGGLACIQYVNGTNEDSSE